VTSPRGNAVILIDATDPSETWKLESLAGNDGTGLGGRRFVKAYPVTLGNQRTTLWVASDAQGVSVRTATMAAWQHIAEAPWQPIPRPTTT
jgi:hypothetical protein